MILEKKYKIEKAVAKDANKQPTLIHAFLKKDHLYATNGRKLAKVPVTPELTDVEGFVTIDAIQHGRKKGDKGRAAVVCGEKTLQARTAKFDRPQQADLKFPEAWKLLDRARDQRTVPVVKLALDARELMDLATALGDSQLVLTVYDSNGPIDVAPMKENGAAGLLAPLTIDRMEEI